MTQQEVISPEQLNRLFGLLPPLESREFMLYVRTQPKELLPAEVLVRAYRLLPEQSVAAQTVLARLFRRVGEGWEYFHRFDNRIRRLTGARHDQDDAFMDAIVRVLETLRTARGQLAEQAWSPFCFLMLVETWRLRVGRRGERQLPEVLLPPDAPEWSSPVLQAAACRLERIEQILQEVLDHLDDDFERAVAAVAWQQCQRPPTSGAPKTGKPLPLTHVFPEHSRHQIMRALLRADARLARALLDDPGLRLLPATRRWLKSRLSH